MTRFNCLNKVLWLLLILLCLPDVSFSQNCLIGPSGTCGNLNAQGGICNSQNVFCIGDSVGITNTSTGNIDSSYVCWGDGVVQGFSQRFTNCRKHLYSFRNDSCVGGDGSIQVSITLTVVNNCSPLRSYHGIITGIRIKFKPHSEFRLTPDPVCVNTPVIISNMSCPNSLTPTYLWNFGDGTTSNSQSPSSHSYQTPGNYTVTHTITNDCGTSTYSQQIRVLPATTIRPVINVSDSCSPSIFTPTINSHNATAFLWSLTNGTGIITLPTDSQPSFTINNQGNYTVHVSATGCCTSPLSICTWDTSLTFYTGPSIQQNQIPDQCGAANITPTAYFQISGLVSAYNWSFPGGIPASSTAATPGNISYNNPGTYIVRLLLTTPCGPRTLTDTFTIRPPTTVQPVITLPGLCSPATFSPIIHSQNAGGFNWSVQGGSSQVTLPTDSQPTITFNAGGNYTVQLQAQGCCSSPASHCNWDTLLTIYIGPAINTQAMPSFCNSASINVANYFTTSGNISSYNWSFPGGLPASSTQTNPGVINFAAPGIYPISLTIAGQCGSLTKTDTLYIGAPPNANITAQTLSGCDSLTVSFTNSSPQNQSYTWISNGGVYVNGTSSASRSPVIFYGSAGMYGISVEVFSAGCPSILNNFVVNIGEAPRLIAAASVPDICDTLSFVFSNYFQLTPLLSDSGYNWNVFLNSVNIFSNSSSNPPTVQLTAYGNYIVNATAWNSCDTILLTDTFNFSPPPVLSIPNDTLVCKGASPINLSAAPSGGVWTWNQTNLVNSIFDPNLTNNFTNYLVYSIGTQSCAVQDSVIVEVFGANISAGPDTSVCKNSGTIYLHGTPSSGVWSGQGITDPLAGSFDPLLVSSNLASLAYNITDTALGCIIRDSLQINIISPTAGALNFPDSACINDVLTFSNLIPNSSATWNFGDSSPSVSSNSTTHMYTNTGAYPVSLILLNQYGCVDTVNKTIEIAEPPNAIFSLDTNRGCAILQVIIMNQSNYYAATSYVWNFGNSTSDTIYQPGTIHFDQGSGDSTIYHIQLMSVNGCGIATFEDSITVYPIPVVDFGISYNDSCSPATVHFANTTTGRPQQYYWYINNVLVSTDSALSTQVFTTDSLDSTYHIMLVSTNFCGNDTLTKNVIVHPNTVHAFFNTDTLYGCRPLPVTFTSFVPVNSFIQWDFGDGNFAAGNTVTHMYDTAGAFTVWQYVDNYCGYDSISQLITVLEQPEVSFVVPAINCGNESIQFLNTSPAIMGSIWDYGDGSPLDSSSSSPGHFFSNPDTYLVSLIGISNLTGCRDTFSLPVLVANYPFANYTIPDNDGCAPFLVNLTSSSLRSNYYIWHLGNGDTLSGNPQLYTYDQPGSYSISLTAIDTNGCKDDTSFNLIQVFPVPVSDFSFIQNRPCETPGIIEFTNESTGANSFYWDFGLHGSTGQQDPSLTINSATEFDAILVSSNRFGCTDTILEHVKVYAKVIADFEVSVSLHCVGQPIILSNTSQNSNNYYWDFGNGDTSTIFNPLHSYSNAGNYQITLIARNDSACFDTLTLGSAIEIFPKPSAFFNYYSIDDTIYNPNGIFQLVDSSIGALQWSWDFGDGISSYLQNPIHRYYDNGSMYITLIVINEFGCPDTIRHIITLDFLGSLFIPNALSPEAGTEATRYFIPKGVGLKEYEIEIFSPYGERVWSSNQLTSDHQPAEQWDGTHNDRPLPQGAYVWKCRAIFENGKIWEGMKYKQDEHPKKTGTVTIIR